MFLSEEGEDVDHNADEELECSSTKRSLQLSQSHDFYDNHHLVTIDLQDENMNEQLNLYPDHFHSTDTQIVRSSIE